MASGNKSLVYNSKERALSPDQNRAQSFRDAEIAEIMRAFMNTNCGVDDLDSGGNATNYSTLESPCRAEIISGLMVSPQLANQDIFVTPGTAFFLFPDGGTDDSNYKYVSDPGILASGTLAIGANASGSIRIDVIECSWGTATAETASRDIFDVVTGTFTPATVVKVSKGTLTYRVRQGTPGSGFPGGASGWTILAVASVPNGSTTNDTVTFWDVRSLVSDRVQAPFNLSNDYPVVRRLNYALDDSSGTSLIMTGEVLTSINGIRAGGLLRRGSPGTDTNSVDLQAAANLASGFSYSGSSFYYTYLLMPFSLPRWARYTDAVSGSRIPRSPRGIIAVSSVAPNHISGKPSSAINLPTSTGLVGSTSDGVCIASCSQFAGVPFGGVADGHVLWARGNNQGGLGFNGSGTTNTSATFTLTEGTTHPANAKAIYAQLFMGISCSVTGRAYLSSGRLDIKNPAGNTVAVVGAGVWGGFFNMANTDTAQGTTGMIRIPLYPQYPALTGAVKNLLWTYTLTTLAGTLAVGSSSILIHGWEI